MPEDQHKSFLALACSFQPTNASATVYREKSEKSAGNWLVANTLWLGTFLTQTFALVFLVFLIVAGEEVPL
jgi:hypothetical protein